MSRELDTKVALAMGYHPFEDGGEELMWREPPSAKRQARCQLPHYSTDCAALPAMLAHLTTLGYVSIELVCHRDAEWCWSAFVWNQKMPTNGHGATLSEAVANLVVTLHERRAK